MIALDRVTYTYPFQDRPAVRNISLDVKPGEAVLLTGASGCGKSTLIRLINGLCPHFFAGRLEGRVLVSGQENAGRRLDEIAADVGTLFQDPEQQFFATTVGDEIAFTHEWRETDPDRIQARIDTVTERFNLASLLNRSLHDLSEGEKQKVALAAIISTAPRALALDEPSANLDPEAAVHLAGHLKALKADGLAIVIVDHRLYWLEDVVDRVVVMAEGGIAAMGDYALAADPVLRASAGLRLHRVPDPRPGLPSSADISFQADTDAPIQVEGLRFAYRGGEDLYQGASFALPRGVTALLGENGSGKTTLARLLTGLSRMRSGRIWVNGEAIQARQLLRQASIVLQNTDHQLHMKTVRTELATATPHLAGHLLAERVDHFLSRFGLAELAERHPLSLSGGEKQRLVIACGMIKQPAILILDEPTSGLDGRNMTLIAEAVGRTADRGACVLLITHDLELIQSACRCALRLPIDPNSID
jgi:energy-coupling factor transport system ATP-binding protein